jgi:hypothetical protein
MEKKITITYRWWRNDEKEIANDIKIRLEEKAEFHIKDMMKQGFTSGQLIDYPNYSGHWEMTTETIK